MKFTNKHRPFSATLFFGLLAALLGGWAATGSAQVPGRIMHFPPGMPMPPMNSDNGSSSPPGGAGGKGSGPWVPSEALGSTNSASSTNDIQLSFQGASIDMIVQWLAQTTGKSVIKSAQVQCQLTINSSKKMPPREALNLVYRALALEGYSVIEFNSSIMIVPQGKEPQMSPELLDSGSTNVPEGNQRLMKVFSLKHLQAADVKDRLATVLSDKATVFVDDQVNQIIITDYNDNIRAASRLIAALDTDTPDDVTVRVLPLKNMSASDLMKEIGPLYQKNGGSSKDSVQITADDQSNALLILSSAANFKVIQEFVASLDTEGSQEKVMRTFNLVNADAQDIAKQLQDLNAAPAASMPRFFYGFGGADNNSSAKKMTVVADRRRNAVIIQAPPAQMEAIGKTIQELDAPVNDGSLAPKIYPMKYVSAGDIEDVLNDLFLKKTQQPRPYWFDDEADTSTPDHDVGRLYGKVRITSEPYSNALIVTANSQENLEAVEAIIKQLDQPSEAGESTLHVGLRFAKADTLANSINVLFAKNGSPPLRANPQQNQNGQNNSPDQSQQNSQSSSTSAASDFDLKTETKLDGYYPWLGGQPDNPSGSGNNKNAIRPVSDLVGRVRAVADDRSNALLISANVHFFPQILKLIEDMDAPADQVLIDARIVEVSSDFLDQLGVRYSPNGAQEFTGDDLDNSFIGNVSANYQKGFGGTTTVNTPNSSTAGTIAQALTSLRSGVLSGSISMDFLVQFLHRTVDATVLADPQLNIRNNETGTLFVGQQVPVPSDSLTSAQLGGQSTTFTYKDVGVTLEVIPHINSSGDVELKIHAESSTVVAGQTVLGGDVFSTANFHTDLTAKDGQTLVLGGIIQKQLSNTTRKTPWLGDIPGLGWAFKKKDKSSQEVELMVFLRPHVIHTPEDASQLLHEVDTKAPAVKKWQDDEHAAKSQEEFNRDK